jgi:thiamine biosynthesis protein ThiS
MRIQLNGEPRDLPDGLTVGSLLGLLCVLREGTAVERNGAVVPGARQDEVLLAEADRIEIVTFVGGG